MTTALIRRHIAKLPDGSVFSTRDMLSYGLRAAVDQALQRMVKAEYIIRVARGVFIKCWLHTRVPSALEVAQVKARAFCKKMLTDGADAAHKLGLAQSGNSQPTFASSGLTTSFQFGQVRIRFKNRSPRALKLANKLPGLIIRALCDLHHKEDLQTLLPVAISHLPRQNRVKLRQNAALMPAWLSDAFYNVRPRL